MKRSNVVHDRAGFSLVEVLLALAIFAIAIVPILYVATTAQRLVRSQSEATDLQQRVRVAAEKLQRDLTIAGAGPAHGRSVGGLSNYFPPIVPARTGLRSPDAWMTAFPDRVSLVYVPDGGWQAPLSASMSGPDAAIPVNGGGPGCPEAGLCGFVEGSRAVIVDTSALGAGSDIFTVTAVEAELGHGPPNAPFSRAYTAGAAHVLPLVQRIYYFDRPNRRLMLYDGYQSDVPLVDNVVDVRFEYFGETFPGPGLRPIPLAQLTDGPIEGSASNGFDADLRSIRLVRVTLRLQAAADDVRGRGEWFARPGRSMSAYSVVPDFEVTFDVAPRNMGPPAVVP
jgi:prepilin-type N-terminal cleavage/methylation domain-containing protein